MRTVLVVVAAATATAVVTAGCTDSRRTLVAAPSRSAAASPIRPSPGDPAVTRQVCRQATTVVASGTAYFNSQIAALERAAAKGDQAGLVAAAEAINTRLAQMAAALTAAAQKKVSPALKTALVTGSAVLSEIPSPAYAGAMADIARRLSNLAVSLEKACG